MWYNIINIKYKNKKKIILQNISQIRIRLDEMQQLLVNKFCNHSFRDWSHSISKTSWGSIWQTIGFQKNLLPKRCCIWYNLCGFILKSIYHFGYYIPNMLLHVYPNREIGLDLLNSVITIVFNNPTLDSSLLFRLFFRGFVRVFFLFCILTA